VIRWGGRWNVRPPVSPFDTAAAGLAGELCGVQGLHSSTIRLVSYSFRKFEAFQRRFLAVVTGRENLHFLHLPKTGGTSIKNALTQHRITPNTVIHLHPHRIRLRDVPRGHRVMFGVRDPLARFVSGFGSRLRKGAPANIIPWSHGEERAFSHFDDPDRLARALDPAHAQHEEALHAMRNIRHVKTSYWDWFGCLEEIKAREEAILFIGFTGSLDADFRSLVDRLKLPCSLALPQNERLAHRAKREGKRTPAVSEEGTLWLKKWYARDYEFLEYCQRWRERQGGPVAKG